MKLKLITVLIATALIIGLFVTAWKISPVRAAGPTCWIVDSLKRPGWNFASLADAINSPSVQNSDEICVRDSHVESLSSNLFINQSDLWIIGAPPSYGPNPTIDLNGSSIGIFGTNVFIWGLNIVDTGTPPSQYALVIEGGGCIIQNNTITGQAAAGSDGIFILGSPNNLVALNTMSMWDNCIVVATPDSTGNDITLNTLIPPFSKGIWLTLAPMLNNVYWNNLWSASELVDDVGNPQNYFDDAFPGGPNWGHGNWIAISDPGGAPYLVPPNNMWMDNHALIGPISQIQGDVNLDGGVNILDAIRCSNDFLKVWGQYGWDPRTDINGDGTVNILDAIILSNHYLLHY
jgi:hypothetical protein